MARTRRTVQEFMAICEAYHAGFDVAGIAQLLGKRISQLRVEQALDWEREQLLMRSEIQSLYDALLETRKLRKQANQVLAAQWHSVATKTSRFAIKEVRELIEQELQYAERIRELATEIDGVSGYEGLRNLPAGLFSEDLEPGGGDGDS